MHWVHHTAVYSYFCSTLKLANCGCKSTLLKPRLIKESTYCRKLSIMKILSYKLSKTLYSSSLEYLLCLGFHSTLVLLNHSWSSLLTWLKGLLTWLKPCRLGDVVMFGCITAVGDEEWGQIAKNSHLRVDSWKYVPESSIPSVLLYNFSIHQVCPEFRWSHQDLSTSRSNLSSRQKIETAIIDQIAEQTQLLMNRKFDC